MLESLDAVLGFSVVMLGISMLVTVLVQTITSVINLRGLALVRGLGTLFEQAGLDKKKAKDLADHILRHPMVTDAIFTGSAFAHATAIRKEELLRMLKQHDEYGIKDLANEAGALLDTANLWFDSQMDRVSQAFARSARLITIAVSIAVAFALHLDAAQLIQRLYSDTDLRAKLVASASTLENRAEELNIVPAATAASPAPAALAPSAAPSASPAEPSAALAAGPAAAAAAAPTATAPVVTAPVASADAQATGKNSDLEKNIQDLKSLKQKLSDGGIKLFPNFGTTFNLEQDVHTPWDYLQFNQPGAVRHLFGVLAAAALLGLGAPFWFNLLKQLTNLRSVVANKEEKEREAAAAE